MLSVLSLGLRPPLTGDGPLRGRAEGARVIELVLEPTADPAGPELIARSLDTFVLPIPAGWDSLREKPLAALRRTVLTAALEVGQRVRPSVVYATDADLCGMAAAAASRRLECPLILGLTSGEVDSALFDERKVAVFEVALRAAAAAAVADVEAASLLAACHPQAAGRVTTVRSLSLAAEDIWPLLLSGTGSPPS